MDSSKNRRNFLSKLSFSLLGAIGFSSGKKANEVYEKTMDKKNTHPVLSQNAMGFNWDTIDPFLFCVHHEDFFPKGNADLGPLCSISDRPLGDDFIIKDGFRMYHGMRVPGFPGHPHRGFETITVVRKGLVDHADSMGASGRYGEGDVQWMTAGKGVQHSEMFPLIHQDKDNPLELFQIWLNLPKKNKMVDPHYKMLWGKTIPKIIELDNQKNKIEIELIHGKFHKHEALVAPPDSWAGNPANEILILNMQLDANAKTILPKAVNQVNRMIYFYEGIQLNLHGKIIPRYHAVRVDPSYDLEIINGNEAAKILVLQGKPINEPVVQYGPFVMNTKEEIHQAFEDFHATQFGGWPWDRTDVVHGHTETRYARYADGKYEKGA